MLRTWLELKANLKRKEVIIMKRYKVVSKYKDSIGNLSYFSFPGDLRTVTYKPGRVAEPGGMGVFCLETKKAAIDYLKWCKSVMIESALTIIEVEPLSRGKRLSCCPTRLGDMQQFYLLKPWKDKIVTGSIGSRFNFENLTYSSCPGDLRRVMYKPEKIAKPGGMGVFSCLDVWICTPGTIVYPKVLIKEEVEVQ